METLFWISIGIVFYTYLGYGLVCRLLLWLRPPRPAIPMPGGEDEWPAVTVLIAAYNEADIIGAKIANTMALDYPSRKLKIMVVADGSNDGTVEIVRQYPQVRLLHQPERRGKMAAVKRGMPLVKTPLTVLTDANALLNPEALRHLLAPFRDGDVGAVAGEKRIISADDAPANAAGEGLYWKYESFLKKQDARLGSIVGAAGELYAVRTGLFQYLPDDTILDDFVQTLRIAMLGYRVDYSPEAYAEETASADTGEELKRKIRICTGGFQAIGRLAPLLNPFRYGMLTFQYLSHRVLRWTVAPLLLPVIFFTNCRLALSGAFLFQALLVLQTGFYLLAVSGHLLRRRPAPFPGFFAPFYFVLMNYSVYAGFIRFLQRKQQVTWEKAKRLEATLREETR